jgi:hypothetical protein
MECCGRVRREWIDPIVADAVVWIRGVPVLAVCKHERSSKDRKPLTVSSMPAGVPLEPALYRYDPRISMSCSSWVPVSP